jgi:Bacteriophage HK97-gp10, putative tail-component
MAQQTRVDINHAGMAALLKSDPVRALIRDEAEKVADRARSSAPVASGDYRDSIRVESATTDRAVERVIATAPHSHIVEAKTGNLARALGGS